MASFKVARLQDAPVSAMRFDRGVTHRLVGPGDGAHAVDLHVNVINTDSGLGPYHFHSNAENVYMVIEGVAEVIIDKQHYLLVPEDVAFIPAGVKHAAGSAGAGPVTLLEIYAPSGQDFNIVDMPATTVSVHRPEIEHLLPPQLRNVQ